MVITKRSMSASLMSCTPHLRDKGPRFDANEGRSEKLGQRVHRAIGPYRHGVQIWEAFHSSEVGFRAKPFGAGGGTEPGRVRLNVPMRSDDCRRLEVKRSSSRAGGEYKSLQRTKTYGYRHPVYLAFPSMLASGFSWLHHALSTKPMVARRSEG